MCSTPGLPTPGSSLILRVSFVDVHSEIIPVQLWGLVGERRDEYLRLSQEIQKAAATRGLWALGGTAALPGELCLVQVGLLWHRGRVLSRQGPESRVFLLDEGRTLTADSGSLVPGRSEFFHLPSEVLGCVLAGLVPAGGGGGESQLWSASALDFLGKLQGKELQGRVLDVLLPHRLVFLEVPSLFQRMQELGLARQVPHSLFRSLLKRYLPTGSAGLGSGDVVLQRVLPKPEQPGLDYFYPQLQLGVTEPVKVTQVCHPHRIHCQLRSFSQEIHRLSESMAHVYRGSTGTEDENYTSATGEGREESPDKPGSPCASCGLDGHWYRALLLETFRPQRCAQVLHVDFGRKELVSCSSLRYLLPEYFRMPVVTYPCALYGLWDGGRGWSRSQVGDLKALILGQVVNAKIEFYCSFEHVYYVTLYGEDGTNLNCVFGLQSCCLADRFLQSQGAEEKEEEEGEEPETALHCQSPAEEADEELSLPALRSIRLKMNTFYDAQVEFVKNPSEFWIGLRKHSGTFSRLMRKMCSFYSSASKLDGVALKPKPNGLCCVKWKENGYYRAVITRLDDKSVDVFLVDRGNSENVDWRDVQMLLPQFRRLPGLALACTLADISPLAETWSQEAISFFKKTVLHKELVIHVLDNRDNRYIVEILDESRLGEENISKVIAQAGYAKYQEFETKGNIPGCAYFPGHDSAETNKISSARKEEVEQKAKRDKTTFVSEALTDSVVVTNVSTGQVVQEKEQRVPVYSPLIQTFLEIKPGSSCKGEIKVGSTVEVKVSYVENPGHFWCQLTRNMQGFKTLMCDIQDYCKNTPIPYQGTTPACLAKRTVNGKWSRALIRETPSSEHVQVVFVDYGDRDRVSVKNICSITEEFLKVKAQAFRCSLYNLIQPTSQNPFAWGKKAVQVFSEFVGNAWEDNLELKCTIFAIASTADEELFYIVDLLTPFQSASRILVEKGLARPIKLPSPLGFPLQLRSYYYSTHDVKVGSEESVYIAHVDNPWTFYCQLGRNAHILEELSCSVLQLSKTLLNINKSPLIPGALCLAKYTDRNWYRGIMIEKHPNRVFFVDFGNIYVVTNDDLLSIPGDTCDDVLFLPMQAVKCSLSDVPDHIPEEITTWFQEITLDKSLKAMVVAKDPDGTLIIELYDNGIQINENVNEKLALLGYNGGKRKQDESEVLSITKTLDIKKDNTKLSARGHLSESVEDKFYNMEILAESHKPKISSACKELKLSQSSTKINLVTQHQDSVDYKNSEVSSLTTEKTEESFAEPPLLEVTKLEFTPSERKTRDSYNKDLPLKFSEFPQKTIMPGCKTTVYVSHINDVSDFYVQLTEDEVELNHLSERLNDVSTRPECYAGPPLQRGDIVCAIFPEDNLWYRAVVKEHQPNNLLSVQFIDYGNDSVIHNNKTGRLDLINALLPRLCIHCSLRGLWSPEILNCKEMTRYFSQRTEEAQIRCEFVKFRDRWEVILADQHGIIAEDMISRYAFREQPKIGPSTRILNGAFSRSANKTNMGTSVFLNWYNPKMKMIRAYATVIDGPEYFWCQFADTEKLQNLEAEVQSAGEQATDWTSCVLCLHIGDPCIVRYREDGHYYRALITSVCEDYCASARLVDFGNIVDAVDPEALRAIPSELLLVPMQAFPCCLSGFNVSEGVCPPEGNDYFYEIVTEDVLELTILEIKKDVCDIPLAIVDLKSKGESINEKMKKYSKIGISNSNLPYKRNGPEIKGDLGPPSPDDGLKKLISKAGQQKTLYVEPQTGELLERIGKDLNMMETKPNKFCDPETDNVFEAFESPCKHKMDTKVPEGKVECRLVDTATFENTYLIPGLNTLLLHASDTKEILELNSLEVPLSPDDEAEEFVELESMELQHSPVGDEEKEEPGLVPPVSPLPRGCDTEVTLEPFTVQLPLICEAEKEPELDLPAAQLSLESTYAQDTRMPSCVECSDDQHRLPVHLHGKPCDPKTQIEMDIYKGYSEYKSRDVISSLMPLFSEEESTDGGKHGVLPDHVSAQPENTYTLKGFTVGSRCVVWSRQTWSECEILEIVEEGTKVLNLSDGIEETVSPENVWNSIPKLDNRPSEAWDYTNEKGAGGDADSALDPWPPDQPSAEQIESVDHKELSLFEESDVC
ncbi:tudor domain-containing protein 6 isoform X1 [Phyllostomus hastatus]|uniref:tudor domain-containing protein 6 isoform X1 n=1 Tax=Phyllostomus hastatus TaxID=9423 RepID=UPI001E6800A3|nr:tudor domain-containing protein 6 isoform X1 [Phyllostomus hastatus]